MGQIRLGEFTDLRKRAWSMELQAFLTKGAVKSFHNSLDAIDKTVNAPPEDWSE